MSPLVSYILITTLAAVQMSKLWTLKRGGKNSIDFEVIM